MKQAIVDARLEQCDQALEAGIQRGRRAVQMPKLALYVSLKAKPGKEAEVEEFLKLGAQLAAKEPGTVTWYGLKEDEGLYSVFDTFEDEAGREAHLNGDIAKALMAKASELFADAPKIHKITLVAAKAK
jgi:quinol monooxygenase YgiN